MKGVLGLPLSMAETSLREAGFTVTAVETRSRKGQPGNEKRVLRARETAPGHMELVYALFKTDLFWMPE
ncbi:hypothetical protein SDC9_201798 [bioreactor metagenome]|uniref:Uncharacterized protein n=1 Tax=bioreactor metagenome TaxID=1076179 RepID=A0A645IUN5_9ZZZZ|nr:hypothetical protein [Candidatus Pelethousia sp.]NCB29864.1 hypothetical protein [Clostridia bacterium]